MLRTILFLIALLFLFNASSQSKEIAKLRNDLQSNDRENSSAEILKNFFDIEIAGLQSINKVEILEKVFTLSEIQSNDQLKLLVGKKLAGQFSRLGKSDASLAIYFEIEPIATKYDDMVSLAIVNTGMGNEYYYLKNYEKALVYFQRAYTINSKHRDSSEIAGSINNIGTTYSRIGEIDSALHYINLGITYFSNLKDTTKLAQTLNNKGSLYHRQMDKTKEALQFFEKALELHLRTGNQYQAGISSINLGVIYYELKEYELGFTYIKKALENAKNLKNIPLLRLSLENITQMYEEQKQYDSAYYYQKEWIAFNDTLNTSEQKSAIEELEDAYKQKQLEQDKKIAELKVDLLNKWIVIAGLVIVVLLILTFYFIYKKKAKEELEATKSEFYANLAHEFRTPVSLIKSPAQQILRNARDKITQERSSTIIKSADQLLELFNQLLDVSKLEAGKLQIHETTFEVVDFTAALIQQVEPLVSEKNIDIIFNPEIKERSILFDPSIFQKVFLNLITNALKFSPEKGVITINLSEKDSFIELDVIDQGSGIDKEVLKRLFKRFNHSDSPKNPNGIGLGLALSKELMQLMGGDLTLKSTSEKGSIFNVKLKIKESNGIISDQNFITHKTDGSITLLLVDDHPELLNHLKQELGNDFNCQTALNGKEGLDKAIECIPDIIISDIAMPEMDGVEMSQKIKENELTEHIPIMLLTARTSKDVKYSALEAGAVSFMNKPFDIAEIKLQLNNFLNWRSTLKEKYSSITPESKEKTSILNHSSATDEDFTIEQLTEELCLSRAQVHRKIKATTGISTSALVRNIRLEKAFLLLQENSELNINEVAYACGFSNPSYFSKSFVDYFSKKPSEI